MIGGVKSSRRALWFVLSVIFFIICLILLITGYTEDNIENTDRSNITTPGWILFSFSIVLFGLSFKG